MRTILFLFAVLFSVAGYGQQQMLLRGAAAGGVSGILDGYNSDLAFCVCWLYSSYSGSLLRVRRDSDNAEQDIGRNGQDIDDASIISFCAGANCYVVTMYDQSGGGNNATQSTAANQPKIYDSATGLVTENTIAAIRVVSANSNYMNLGSTISAPSTISSFLVDRRETDSSIGSLLSGTSTGTDEVYTTYHQSNDWIYMKNTARFIRTNAVQNIAAQKIYTGIMSSGGDIIALNGTSLATTANSSFAGVQGFQYVFTMNQSAYSNSRFQAFVFFLSDETANRTAIETALNNYFSIY